jgi:hypothetical protein
MMNPPMGDLCLIREDCKVLAKANCRFKTAVEKSWRAGLSDFEEATVASEASFAPPYHDATALWTRPADDERFSVLPRRADTFL